MLKDAKKPSIDGPSLFIIKQRKPKKQFAHLHRGVVSVLKAIGKATSKTHGIRKLSQKWICEQTDFCRKTVSQHLKTLEDEGIISRSKTYLKSGRRGADMIVFESYLDHLNAPENLAKQRAKSEANYGTQSDSLCVKNADHYVTSVPDYISNITSPQPTEPLEVSTGSTEPLPVMPDHAPKEQDPYQMDEYSEWAALADNAVEDSGYETEQHPPAGRELFVREPEPDWKAIQAAETKTKREPGEPKRVRWCDRFVLDPETTPDGNYLPAYYVPPAEVTRH